MNALRQVALGLLRLALVTLAAAAILVGAGVAWSVFGGHGLRSSIASALFIGGAVIIVLNGLSGGGTRGRIADVSWYGGSRALPTPMPFEWVMIGALVIGVGVLVVVV